MKNEEYQALVEKHPNLTSEGFGVNMTYAEGLSHEDYFSYRRRELQEAFQEFSHCQQWLQTHDIEGEWNAHYWKDRVQSECRPPKAVYFHIPRGAFILAAIEGGLTVRPMEGSTDAWISNPVRDEVITSAQGGGEK